MANNDELNDDEFFYEEIEGEDDKSFEASLSRILHGKKDEINCQYAAKIISLNNQHSVNIEYYVNGVADVLYNVPVKHYKTSSAYFILKLKKGDKGVVRFFDDDIELYRKKGVVAESSEKRVHDLNDNLFEVGFYPDTENYEYPEGDLVLGTVEGAYITITGGIITVSGGTANFNVDTINLGSGGKAIARVDDEIEVEITSGSSAGTYTGKIISGSSNNTSN